MKTFTLLITAAIAVSASIPANAIVKKQTSKEYTILEISQIKSRIRDDYRQLQEDKEDGYDRKIEEDQAQIEVDKEDLQAAYQNHHLKYRPNSWRENDYYREIQREGKVDVLHPELNER